MKIVIINGVARVGKDLFVTFCEGLLGTERIENYSTVDYVKAVAASVGWTGSKTDKDRKFLHNLKMALTEWDNIPLKKTKEAIIKFEQELSKLEENYAKNAVIFIHCREPIEIERLKQEFNAETLLIRREAAERNMWSNAADQGVYDYQYDCIVDNNGTLDELRLSAETYLREVLKLDI